MKVGPVALRYATALFELAREKGVLERVAADVERLHRDVSSPSGRELFDARVSAERRRARIEAWRSSLHPLTGDFLGLLLAKRRLPVLPELRAAFRRSLLAERNAVEGVVESARALSPAEVGELAAALGPALGKSVELSARVNPELIAGVRVLVDNRLVDQSAAGRLEGLRARMLSARLKHEDAGAATG